MRHVAVGVPATTANLGPGFDALGAALTLRLVVETTDFAGARVRATGEGAAEVPDDETNLVWRAFARACDEFAGDVADVTLAVHNAIPLARGLGSSSAAIVGGVAAARGALGVTVPDADVAQLATEIEGHPDNVVPALLGGLTVSASAGDRLVVRRVLPHARLRPVVLVPEVTQSTEEARGVLPDSLGRAAVAQQGARAAHVVGGLVGAWPVDVALAGDLLHEPPRLNVMTSSARVLDALRGAGVHAWLSGAGPTVAAVVARRGGALPASAVQVAAAEGFTVRELDWALDGTVTCPAGGCAISGRPDCWQCPRRGI